jgi:hypothetical protein
MILKALMIRDVRLFVLRGSEGFLSLFLYGLVLLFLGATGRGALPWNAMILFSFVMLTQNVYAALRDDSQGGVLDMMPQHHSFLPLFLVSKALVLWISIGIPLTVLMMVAGHARGTTQEPGLFLLLSAAHLAIIFISLMTSCFLLGARSLKGGLLLLTGPFYLPLFLCILGAMENSPSWPSAFVLSLGMILFYSPLCLLGGTKALRMVRHYQ